jgi:hypothetical protein
MSSGSTRAAMAATSRGVKQKLVHILFRQKYKRTGPEGHKLLDFSIYSYDDLRKEYLKRLHLIHPDKHKIRSAAAATTNVMNTSIGNNNNNNNSSNNNKNAHSSIEELKKEFRELQSTWDKYEELTKSMMKVTNNNNNSTGNAAEANFTTFGVGCSFSDNDEERALRNEITDQACRGWFSSGLIASSSGTNNDNDNDKNNSIKTEKKSLIDDNMFVEVDLHDVDDTNNNNDVYASSKDRIIQTKDKSRRDAPRRTLVQGIKYVK